MSVEKRYSIGNIFIILKVVHFLEAIESNPLMFGVAKVIELNGN